MYSDCKNLNRTGKSVKKGTDLGDKYKDDWKIWICQSKPSLFLFCDCLWHKRSINFSKNTVVEILKFCFWDKWAQSLHQITIGTERWCEDFFWHCFYWALGFLAAQTRSNNITYWICNQRRKASWIYFPIPNFTFYLSTVITRIACNQDIDILSGAGTKFSFL